MAVAAVTQVCLAMRPAAADDRAGTKRDAHDHPHVRMIDRSLTEFVSDVTARSPTFRELVESLAR